MTKLFSYLPIHLCLACLVLALSVCSTVEANNWQLMMLPNGEPTGFNSEPLSADALKQFEDGLSLPLSEGLDTLVSHQKVFRQCQQKWCGHANLADAVQHIRSKADKVQLIILYEFSSDQKNKLTVSISLIDPLSFTIRFADKLISLSDGSAIDYFSFGQKVGRLIEKRLQEMTPSNLYQLLLSGFVVNELSGLSTYILSNSSYSTLSLISSRQNNSLLGRYQPLVTSKYKLQSSLSATQFEQLLQQYFTRQNIEIQTEYTHATKLLTLKRVGNPYAPSLVTLLVLFAIFIALTIALVRRRILDLHLQEYTAQRNAKDWLASYKKACFPLYRLKNKWGSQLSYWHRLERESESFARQAKIYCEAGDMNTSKLLISKALHANSANVLAKSLSDDIKEYETNTQKLSKNEQWIRNKIAKAMNNYRQQQPIAALRRAYQAHNRALQCKDLKRQAKAIKKLINKIKAEFATQSTAILLNCSNDPFSYLICQNKTVHIGRLSTKTDAPWISNQDSIFYVNHKSVSRIGQQCQIQRVVDGYCLHDMGSKNGSVINQQACAAKQLCKLQNGDIIQLGAKTVSTAVRLLVTLSPDQELLQLSFAQQASALLDKRELNKIWPDNSPAIRTVLTCVKRSCHLLYNPVSGKIQLMHLNANNDQSIINQANQLHTASPPDSLIAICKIKLGSTATISPIDLSIELLLGEIPLLGEVPLMFPCNLQYTNSLGKTTSFELSEYDSTAIRYAHLGFLEASIER